MSSRPLVRLLVTSAAVGALAASPWSSPRRRRSPQRRFRLPLRRHVSRGSRIGKHLEAPPRAVHPDEHHQGPRHPDVRRREAARRPDPPGQRRWHPDRRQGPGRRDDHRLQQDRDRRWLRRHPGRRGPGVPRQARLRPAHRRRPRHRLQRGTVERVRQPREQGRRRGDGLGAPAAVEQRQHRDDRGVVHGHRPDLRGRRPARRASRRSSRRSRRPTSTATSWRPVARSTPASCRCGWAWSPPPA